MWRPSEAIGMCEPPKEQKTAEHVDQPAGPALKLGHGDEQKRERRLFGTVGLGAHRFDQGFLAAIANGNFERQALADHIDAEQEKQKPDGGGVKGGDAEHVGPHFQGGKLGALRACRQAKPCVRRARKTGVKI